MRAFLAWQAAWMLGADGACYKHAECGKCIYEKFDGGSCMWYTPPGEADVGACVAGKAGTMRTLADGELPVSASYATWTMTLRDGQQANFSVNDLDTLSDGSCYTTNCEYNAQCALGYHAVRNQPCYSETVHPSWRILRCCREQRNVDGYLRGFNSWRGHIEGSLFFAACCSDCYPGQVNTGCDAFFPGECKDCPAGTFNPFTTAGSVCQPCQPCEAGSERKACTKHSAGRCEPCDPGTYKTRGVEGGAGDTCAACGSCPAGSVRVDCGGASPGYCLKCRGGMFYASPICKTCPICRTAAGHLQDRIGCGGLSVGVCAQCDVGRYQEGEACQTCETCPPALAVDTLGGMNFTATSPVRVGCGGLAPGACAGLALAVDLAGASACPTVAAPGALCPGVALEARWAVAGVTAEKLGLCSASAGTCLAGVFRATLQRRTVAAPQGVEMASLGSWWPEELGPWPSASVNETGSAFLAHVTFPALRSGLPEGAGYFIRVTFADLGGGCCGAREDSPLTAESDDFAIAERMAMLEDVLDGAPVTALRGDWQSASSQLADACKMDVDATTTAGHLVYAACEGAKAVKLATPMAQSTTLSAPLLKEGAQQADLARRAATIPASEARNVLSQVEKLLASKGAVLPSTPEAWRALVAPLAASPTTPAPATGPAANETDFARVDTSSPLKPLLDVAIEAAAAADALSEKWHADASGGARQLGEMLEDLKRLDAHLARAATSSGFNVIRLAQDVTYRLKKSVEAGPPPAHLERDEWLRTALESAGSCAVMLLGTWSSSWRHSLDWRLAAEVGNVTIWPPAGAPIFGGAPLPSDAVDLEDSRKRLWAPFREVAGDVLAVWRARRLAGNATVNVTAAPAGHVSLDDLAVAIEEMVGLVERLTEDVLDPLTRAGSALLRGPLPATLPGCGGRRRLCLSDAAALLGEPRVIEDVWLGFGARAVRPWLEVEVEEERLRRAAGEVLRLSLARAKLLEEVLLRTVDVREAQAESEVASVGARRAHAAATHVGSLALWARDEGPAGPGAAWRWRDISASLGRALTSAQASAQRLGRRRLTMLERLAIWTGAGWWGSTAIWRITFLPGRDEAARLTESIEAAGDELERGLTRAREYSTQVGTGFMRIEVHPGDLPVAFAGLRQHGTALFHVRRPPGKLGFRMHDEAYAFFLSARYIALPLEREDQEAPVVEGAASSSPHVELRLRRLLGVGGDPPRLSEEDGTFTTRHLRRECAPLWTSTDAKPESAALWPMEEVWVLEAYDGPTRSKLVIEEDTSLRLLFRVDVPDSNPPWQLRGGAPPDLLYRLPEGPEAGQCDGLRTVFGSLLNATTTTQYVVTSTGSSTARSAAEPEAPGWYEFPTTLTTTTLPDKIDFVGQKFGQVGEVEEAEEGSPMLIVGLIGGGAAVACLAIGGGSWWLWHRRRRLRRKTQGVTELEEPEEPEEPEWKPAPMAPPLAAGLRHRTPSPAAGVAKGEIPALALRPSARDPQSARSLVPWDTTETPRDKNGDRIEEDGESDSGSSSSSGSSSGSRAVRSRASSRSWADGRTPSNGTPKSSSSGSSASSRSSLNSMVQAAEQAAAKSAPELRCAASAEASAPMFGSAAAVPPGPPDVAGKPGQPSRQPSDDNLTTQPGDDSHRTAGAAEAVERRSPASSAEHMGDGGVGAAAPPSLEDRPAGLPLGRLPPLGGAGSGAVAAPPLPASAGEAVARLPMLPTGAAVQLPQVPAVHSAAPARTETGSASASAGGAVREVVALLGGRLRSGSGSSSGSSSAASHALPPGAPSDGAIPPLPAHSGAARLPMLPTGSVQLPPLAGAGPAGGAGGRWADDVGAPRPRSRSGSSSGGSSASAAPGPPEQHALPPGTMPTGLSDSESEGA